jgi:hypothetical protein
MADRWYLFEGEQPNPTFLGVRVMVITATFNNFSVISYGGQLIGGEIRVPGENHRSAISQ